jgi:hypothetical protein
MEARENKIISEKLNSLDNLPEGYEPNLSAKWDILYNSLPKRNIKVTRMVSGIAIAASLLLAISLLWMNQLKVHGKKDAPSSIHIHPPIQKTIENFVLNNPSSLQTGHLFELEKSKRILKIPLTKRHPANAIVQSELKSEPQVIPRVNMDTLIFTSQIANSPSLDKKKKRTVFQKDFDGPLTVRDTVIQKTAVESFKIRVNVFKNQPEIPNHPSVFRVRENL